MSKFGEIGLIEDVNKSVWQYIRRRWGWKFFLPAILLILLQVTSAYYVGGNIAMRLIVVPFIWIIGGIGFAQSKVRAEFMRQFALRNNFTYVGAGDPGSALGALFQRGHSREIADTVSGVLDGYEFRFFFFYYTVGSGKHKKTYTYTVCEIKTKGNAPDIVVESRADWDFQSYASGRQKEMPVESSFKELFALFAPEDFEIETLEIFTPDVLSELINRAQKYNFEFIEDRLYVFRLGEIGKRAELEEFLKLTDYLVDTVVPKVFRLSDDVHALKEARARNEAR